MSASSGKFIGSGIIASLLASLCCITPLLAIVGGASGALSTFSWVEPFRPYLIGLTVVFLAAAWYQRLKASKAATECACEGDEKPSFWRTNAFLTVITVLAVLLLTFPYYASMFYAKPNIETSVTQADFKQTLNLQIEGMTCTGCEAHVNQEVSKLPGILNVTTSYEKGNALVTYDSTKVKPSAIVKAAQKTGYSVNLRKQ
jgi:mercuric ion transport protein